MRDRATPWLIAAIVAVLSLAQAGPAFADNDDDDDGDEFRQTVQLGPRPFYLIDSLRDEALKAELLQCAEDEFEPTAFSIGHRGAALQFPEHTRESYVAAARMGAGIVECDVTFTKDRELVCRHSQCDLHTTTNILAIPELAAQCSEPFTPADPAAGTRASARCCTSDLTLAQFRLLNGKMDAANADATTVEDYLSGTADWRTDLYATTGTLMTHAESIELLDGLGVDFTPELKAPSVAMPFEGTYSQTDFAQQMIDEYRDADIDPDRVFAQSFNPNDVLYWINREPAFGNTAVLLDGRYTDPNFDHTNPATWSPTMDELSALGVRVLAPPMWMLVGLNADGEIMPSIYAASAKAAGLDLIAWTLERSGPLVNGGGFYYQTIADITDNDGVTYEVLDVLARDVGVLGVFSDWPATTTYYANCMGLE